MDQSEIICISSDDEENTKHNKVHDKQCLIVKQPMDKHVSPVLMEHSMNENEKTETDKKKRKISEILSNNSPYSENKTKVIVLEDDSINKYTVEKSDERTTAQVNEKNEMLKPKLVVKEKKSISLVEQDIFPMFISLCLQKDHSEDMKKVVNKLKRRYEQLDPTYANSEAFKTFLNEKRNNIMVSKYQLYTNISEVMNKMKNSRNKSLKLTDTNSAPNTNKLNTDNLDANKTVHSDMSYRNNNTDDDNESVQSMDYEMENKIRQILKAMKKCEKYIKKLEESEINFDDENNSNYIRLEKYKYRMVELHNKYCEYTGESADAERQYLRPKHFSLTGIVAVDHAITSFINSKISKRNKQRNISSFASQLIFPDYRDILECVTKCNELHNLGLDNKRQQQIAKKAFTELGEYLQRCRRNDYWDTFSLFLEDKEDDPALKDPELAEKLIQNKREGDKRLASIFEEYVKKQEEMKDASTNTSETSSEIEEMRNEENEDEDTNYEFNIDDDGTDLNVDKDKVNTGEDENNIDKDKVNTDGGENNIDKDKVNTDEDANNIDKNKVDIDSKSNDIQDCIIAVEDKHQTEINNRLESIVNNDLQLTPVDSAVNTSKPKEVMKETKTLPKTVPQNLNTSSDVTPLTTLDTKILVDSAKENEININNEKSMSKAIEDKKLVLRVCSFAKVPGTWKDNQAKVDRVDENTSKTSVYHDIIDLTQESPKQNSANPQVSTQVGFKVLPSVKDKRKMSNENIIKVKNVMNNYVKLNSKKPVTLNNTTKLQSEITTSSYQVADKNGESRTISFPSKQCFNRETNDNNQVKSLQTEKDNIIVQVSQSAQITLLFPEQEGNALQQSKANASISQFK